MAYTNPPRLDFNDHQRSVFCVFSGAGVNGLRRFFNTTPEFNEYTDGQARTPRQRSATHGGDGAAPTNDVVDIDAIDDGDGVEDDDMGDGSEIVMDPGNFQQATGNNPVLNQVPPPPPLHHPPPDTLFGHTQPTAPPHPSSGSGAAILSYGGTVALQSIQSSTHATASNGNGGGSAGPHGSLENVITASLAPTGAPGPSAAPSTAGVSLFGSNGPAVGPSTASLQGWPSVDANEEDHGRT